MGGTDEETGLLSRSQIPGAYDHNSKFPGLRMSIPVGGQLFVGG
jgi:hypothetical protein